MGKIIKHQIQGMSWWMKTSLVLLLTLATTMLMYQGWYKPKGAEASVAVVNAWPSTPQIVSNAATGTVTGAVTVGAGTNRVMLVAVGAEYTAAPATQPMTVTYGGQTVFPVAQNIGATGTIWLGIINETGLAAATSTTLSVTNANTTNLTAMYAAAAVYQGVDQTTTISGSSTVASNTAVTAMTLPAINVKGAAGNTAFSFYITNRNGQASTPDATYTENVDYTGTNFNMAFNTITTAPAALLSSAPVVTTGTASTGSAVAVALVPVGVTGIGSIGTCGGCHFYPGTTNPVQDGTARNTPVGEFPGSHVKHVTNSSMNCTQCHYDNKEHSHSKGFKNITGSSLPGNAYSQTKSIATTNTPVFGTCTNTYCHGTSTKSPTWGTSTGLTTCLQCHGYRSTGWKSLAGATANTDSKVGAHFNHISSSGTTKYSKTFSCQECHAASIANATDSPNAAGHIDTATPAEVVFGALAATNSVPAYSSATGVCSNTWCHGAGMVSNSTNPPSSRTASPTWGTPFLGVASVVGNGSTTPGSGDCAKCHGYPPMTASTHSGKLATDCKTCHPHVNAAGTGFDDASKHINGTIEGGGDCTGCHASTQGGRRVAVINQFNGNNYSHHYQGTAALDKTVCYSCHWEADATGTMTTHHKEQTVGFKNKVQLVVWGTSTTRPTSYVPANYVLYSSGGITNSTRTEIAKITTHCSGCHNDTNKTTASFPGDTGTPSKYSWEAKPTTAGGFGAAQSIAAKYAQTTTTNWGKYATAFSNARSTVVKALAGGHGNATANVRGWSTIPEVTQGGSVANYPNTGSNTNIQCFDCHNSHGSQTPAAAANAVTTSYSSATGRGKGGILKDTTALLGGYTNTYRSYSGGNATQKNVYRAGAALCFDCHNNANAGAFTSAGNTSPWGYSGTFGATQGIWGYNDSPNFGRAAGVFAKAQTFNYLATISTNKGGHFGKSSALLTTPGRQINGLCTNCHDPHGVSPALGTNQQYAVPMLKNTFVTSPYKQDVGGSTTTFGGGDQVAQISGGAIAGYHIDQNTLQAATTGSTGTPPGPALRWDFAVSANTLQTLNDTQFAGLCTGCHAKANINSAAAASSATWKSMTRIHNSVKGWASTGGGNTGNVVHAYTCSKCHTPHNSYLPRLLVTDCLDVKHKGRVATGGTMPAALTISNNSGNGLGRFPGGGGAATFSARATANGPWFFGTTAVAATRNCHDSNTAGGTTYTGAEQMWNTKSTW